MHNLIEFGKEIRGIIFHCLSSKTQKEDVTIVVNKKTANLIVTSNQLDYSQNLKELYVLDLVEVEWQ